MPTQSPFDILELLVTITSHLSRHDLTSCIRVSHTWSKLFTPMLWRTLSITQPKEYFPFMTSATLASLSKHAQLIHGLETAYLGVLMAFYEVELTCRFVQELGLPCLNLGVLVVREEFLEVDPVPPTLVASLPLSEASSSTTAQDKAKVLRVQQMNERKREGARNLYTSLLQEQWMKRFLHQRDEDRLKKQSIAGGRVFMSPMQLQQQEALFRNSIERQLLHQDTLERNFQNKYPEKDQGNYVGLLKNLIKDHPQLSVFSHRLYPFHEPELIRTVLESLKCLRRLELVHVEPVKAKKEDVQFLMENLPPSLEHFALSLTLSCHSMRAALTATPPQEGAAATSSPTSDRVKGQGRAEQDTEVTLFIPPNRLVSLLVDGDLLGNEEALWLPLIRSSPGLEKISLSSCRDSFLKELASTLKEYCPVLKNLTLGSMDVSVPDSTIASLIQSSTQGLENLALFSVANYNTDSISHHALIEQHSATLTRVQLIGCRDTRSEQVQELLGNCSKLSVLTQEQDFRNTTYEASSPMRAVEGEVLSMPQQLMDRTTVLDARVESSWGGRWVCEASLRVLKMRIVGVPRIGMVDFEDGQDDELGQDERGQGQAGARGAREDEDMGAAEMPSSSTAQSPRPIQQQQLEPQHSPRPHDFTSPIFFKRQQQCELSLLWPGSQPFHQEQQQQQQQNQPPFPANVPNPNNLPWNQLLVRLQNSESSTKKQLQESQEKLEAVEQKLTDELEQLRQFQQQELERQGLTMWEKSQPSSKGTSRLGSRSKLQHPRHANYLQEQRASEEARSSPRYYELPFYRARGLRQEIERLLGSLNRWQEQMKAIREWRTRIHHERDAEAAKEVQEGYPIHQRVYAQLGKMTALEELYLGYCPANISPDGMEDGDPGGGGEASRPWEDVLMMGPHACYHPSRIAPLQDGLSLTMASGLGLLGGLKRLKVLNVDRVVHGIGVEEIKWMMGAWPRLCRIEGLMWMEMEREGGQPTRGRRKRMEEVVGWLKEHQPGLVYT